MNYNYLPNKIEDFIQENTLFDKTHHLLLAMSGGVDSIVLARILIELNYSFTIAHVNFQLRAEESEADELFVREFAKNFNVQCFVERFDTSNYAQQNNLSIQMAARVLRYDWFEKIRNEHNMSYIITAHHLNDSIETVLLNLVRGTGIAGLHGILPKQNQIVRPLLCISKEEILGYATQKGFLWREDSSNTSDKYHRNFIRLNIIPKLKEINPQLEHTFLKTLQRFREAEKIVEVENSQFKEIVVEKTIESEGIIKISIPLLKKIPSPTLQLFYWLKEYGFQYDQCKLIYKNIDSEAGKIYLTEKYRIIKDRTYLFLQKNSQVEKGQNIENEEYIIFELQKQFTSKNFTLFLERKKYTQDYDIPRQSDFIALDMNKIEFPLIIRKWQYSDRFQPLGMTKGSKKISDFLKDIKIPLHLKKNINILLSDNKIVWVIGLRADEKYKITPETEDILEIKLEWKN
jgi:tRNA(Ile)-lysidine synthase